MSTVSHGHVESNELSSFFVSFIVVNDGSNTACIARRLENNLSRPMWNERTKCPEGEISINVSLSFHHSKLDSTRAWEWSVTLNWLEDQAESFDRYEQHPCNASRSNSPELETGTQTHCNRSNNEEGVAPPSEIVFQKTLVQFGQKFYRVMHFLPTFYWLKFAKFGKRRSYNSKSKWKCCITSLILIKLGGMTQFFTDGPNSIFRICGRQHCYCCSLTSFDFPLKKF